MNSVKIVVELSAVPLKNGDLTPAERKIIHAMAGTGDRAYAQTFAGVTQPAVSKALQRPAVQAEIAQRQVERLFCEALPAAVDCLIGLIINDKAPAGARVQAAKVVMDRTLGLEGSSNGKEAHEMTGEELARAIDELTRIASDKARDVTPDLGILG